MLKVIFFDAAGTLFEPREPVGTSYARIARSYGVDAGAEQVNRAFRRVFHGAPGLAFGPGHPATELRRLERKWWYDLVAASFAGLGSFTSFDDYFEELFAFFGDPTNWRRDPQAEPTLSQLRAGGFALGMVSNFDHRLYGLLEGLELAGHFTSVTISSEAGYAKPAPEIFRIALEKHGVAPREAMHVGDAEHLDIAGALGARIPAVLLDPAATEPLRMEDRRARVAGLGAVVEAARHSPFP